MSVRTQQSDLLTHRERIFVALRLSFERRLHMAAQAMDLDFDVDESDDEAPSELRFELRHFKTGDDTEDTPVSYWLEQGVTM